MPPRSKKGVTTPAHPAPPPPSNSSTKSEPLEQDPVKKAPTNYAPTTTTNGTHTPTNSVFPSQQTDPTLGDSNEQPAVNRKKQKRREKEAAKRAVEQQMINGHTTHRLLPNGQSAYPATGRGPPKGYFTEESDYVHPDFAADNGGLDDHFYSGEEDEDYLQDPGMERGDWPPGMLGKKKKRNRFTHASLNGSSSHPRNSAAIARPHLPHPPTLSNAAIRTAHRMSNESIWNTSTQAERENIKQFWLDLGEEDRRSLVKVEKEAVLRKMKEQQKHSCSCSVCGRKRTAIEEELEVLYDAYYEELEQFADQHKDLTNAPQLMAPPRTYRQLRGPAHPMAGSYPPERGRVHEIGEDDQDLDDDEEYEDDEEPYSDDDLDDLPPGPPDFFTFGNSLTVKDGILTVADDLLKNDGKHFIDMMEQLAERRMQREEEIHDPSTTLAHQNVHQGHNHPPLDDDDDYDDDEDDEDYDSQEEDDYEGDEMDSMTEEQRMEEGRRMFQIFAARMFEQRVLTAYREKVAQERQQKLLEELDEEGRLDAQREAKKAKEAAKKKEKKRLQKQAKDEEKARRDAEKAAQDQALKEVEEKRLEELRQRKEEQRKKREAEKKASEEERLRKEAEKLRRAHEDRERQAELERKQKEAREKEKKRREETRRKEREERETREKEAKERKGKEEQVRKDKEVAAKAERDARDRTRQEPGVRRQPIALPPGLHPPAHGSHLQSPHFQVATPIMPPKIPTPNRNRQPSQPGQQSHGSSPRSQPGVTDTSRSTASPASVAVPQNPAMSSVAGKPQGQPPILHHPQPSAPLSPLSSQGRAGQQAFGMSGLGMNGPPASGPPIMPVMAPHMPIYQGPPMGGQQRFGPPHMPYPPGFSGPRHFMPNQPLPFHSQAPMPGPLAAPPNPLPQAPSHSRQQSESNAQTNAQPAPIARPGPIGRPTSTTPDKQKNRRKSPDVEMEQLATQLGSKALLDDSDLPLSSSVESKAGISSLGAPGSGRATFSSSFGDTKHDTFGIPGQGWSGFSPSVSSTSSWGAPGSATRSGSGWPQSNNNAFGGMASVPRTHASRPVAIRLMLAQACRQLSTSVGQDGYIPAQSVFRQVEILKSPNEPPISMDEMLAMCDTEGNSQNGGGSFEVRSDARGKLLRFEPDVGMPARNSAGDIGSPVMSHGQPASFGGIGATFGTSGRGF